MEGNEMTMQDTVTITCYGTTETMSRISAINKYGEGVRCCEGSERDRYVSIYYALLDGKTNINID